MTPLPHFRLDDRRDDAPGIVPRTPRHRSHDEINELVGQIATKHKLPLERRDGYFSPSSYPKSNENSCYSSIRFLFYSDRSALNKVISKFENHESAGFTTDQRLQRLENLLSDEQRLVRGRRSSSSSFKSRPAAARPSENTESLSAHEGPANPSLSPGNGHAGTLHYPVLPRACESLSIVSIPIKKPGLSQSES